MRSVLEDFGGATGSTLGDFLDSEALGESLTEVLTSCSTLGDFLVPDDCSTFFFSFDSLATTGISSMSESEQF